MAVECIHNKVIMDYINWFVDGKPRRNSLFQQSLLVKVGCFASIQID